jgi:hypothetical protein
MPTARETAKTLAENSKAIVRLGQRFAQVSDECGNSVWTIVFLRKRQNLEENGYCRDFWGDAIV